MILSDIPPGAKVYIDANIFIYHFSGMSQTATDFLERCEQGDLVGVTGIPVLLEVHHRLMVLEAIQRGHVTGSNPARQLASKPDVIRGLTQHAIAVAKIRQMGIDIVDFHSNSIELSREYRQLGGLLTNDSIIAFEAVRCGAEFIATSDAGFDTVGSMIRAFPNDL